MKHLLILAIALSCAAGLTAMDDNKSEHASKRRRTDDSYLLLISKGIRYDMEQQEQREFTALAERMENEIKNSELFDCFICTQRFSYSRRIVLLPCGKHRVCEECAIKLLCPSTRYRAPVKQCPACRETPSNQMAARTLFTIAHRQATQDGKLLSLRQAQGLFIDKPDDDEEEDSLTADAIATALGGNNDNAEQEVDDVTAPDGSIRHVIFAPNIPPTLRALILSELRRTGELPPDAPF